MVDATISRVRMRDPARPGRCGHVHCGNASVGPRLASSSRPAISWHQPSSRLHYDFAVITSSETTVADVMLTQPKTLPVDVTVADARTALEQASVKMLLLVDGDRFCGAVTAVPADADPDELALTFRDDSAVTVTPAMPAAEALDRLEERASGRVIVVDDERLVGLVCLESDGTTFCGLPAGPVEPGSR
jgi:CBS domain-containing protein